MRLYGLLGGGGGGQVCICVQSMWQTRGVWGCSPAWEILILLDTTWWNLGLFSHKHNLTIYMAFIIIDLHVI